MRQFRDSAVDLGAKSCIPASWLAFLLGVSGTTDIFNMHMQAQRASSGADVKIIPGWAEGVFKWWPKRTSPL
ncbi:hypothetical protein EDF56_11656 [Novosphingobium sp. PhB165]|nr:hypothetical protein EDF56_11656 [Novosphingobium sp. PhB165]